MRPSARTLLSSLRRVIRCVNLHSPSNRLDKTIHNSQKKHQVSNSKSIPLHFVTSVVQGVGQAFRLRLV